MTTHTLALVVLGLLIAYEGYGLSTLGEKTEFKPRHLISIPLSALVW